jgi:hypothetical protein
MIKVTYYETATGRIVGAAICTEEEAEANTPLNCSWVAGLVEDEHFYVQDGVVTAMPSKPGLYYVFDYGTKQWVDTKTPEIEANLVRDKRLQLLAQSDWTDTVSAQTRLGATLYQAWQDYRQALRDIPAQAGYPFNVTWPNAPSN